MSLQIKAAVGACVWRREGIHTNSMPENYYRHQDRKIAAAKNSDFNKLMFELL